MLYCVADTLVAEPKMIQGLYIDLGLITAQFTEDKLSLLNWAVISPYRARLINGTILFYISLIVTL